MADQTPTQTLQIESTPPARRSETLQLLRIGESRIQRMLAAERTGELDMHGLFQARRGRELVGAAWGQVTPGRTAFCWPAGLVPGEPEDTAIHLQTAVDNYLDREHVAIVQAVLPVRAVTDAMRLVRAGYHHLADLDYLVCHSDRFPREKPSSDLDFEPFTPIRGSTVGENWWNGPMSIRWTASDWMGCGRSPTYWPAIAKRDDTALIGGCLSATSDRMWAVFCWPIILSTINAN